MPRYPGWTEAAVQRYLKGQQGAHTPQAHAKGRKYYNVPTMYAGLQFDSKREAQRAQELMLMEQAGLISDLVLDKRQLHYDLIVNGQKVGTYTPDSRYMENGVLVVEDVKSKPTKTREYRRTKKLMLAIYSIVIRET
jgi:hypothetical protein